MSYQNFEEINANDPGIPGFKYGADDLLELFKILNGIVVPTRRPHVLNPWLWEYPLHLKIPQSNPAGNPEAGTVFLYPDSATGRLIAHKSSGETVEIENIIHQLQDLDDTQFTDLTNNDGFRWNSSLGKWVNVQLTGGEANTASNVGTAGVGQFKQKSALNLEFKKNAPKSSRISIEDNVGASQVDYDVVESSLALDNIGGTLSVDKGGTGANTLTGILRGNGTNPYTAISLGNTGDILTNVDGTPTFQAPAGSAFSLTDVKTGDWTGLDSVTACSGLLQGRLQSGSGSYTPNIDPTLGPYVGIITGGTSGNTACIRSLAAKYILNSPTVTIGWRFRLPSTAANRTFIGVSSSVSGDPSGTAYGDSKHVFLLYLPSGGSTWHLMVNDGTGPTGDTDTTIAKGADNAMHTFIIKLVNTPKLQWSLDNSNFADVSSNIPSSSQGLGILTGIETTTSSNKTLDLFRMKISI